jgi:hypothetical protein
MHLGGARIGEADVNAARHQGPNQTFRTVHSLSSCSISSKCMEDQSFLTRFVKGFPDISAIAWAMVVF